MTYSKRLAFASACLGMLLFGISLITLGAVAPGLQAKFNLDRVSSGALFSILPFGILGGTFLFGPFADRYGYKIIFLLSCLCMFAGFEGIAYASSLSILKICVFLFGLGGGAINGSTNALVADISQKNKGANLSLLGVFFAIGALGMPFILGVLEKQFSFEVIVSSVGYLTLLFAIVFLITTFPEPKQREGISLTTVTHLLKTKLILLIGFFLFCQSSFEGIINNWTTTYLTQRPDVTIRDALYALSSYVVGMAIARVLMAGALRNIAPPAILIASFILLISGTAFLQFSASYMMAVIGLVLLGAGLAPGYPVMLGFVGDRYAAVSGTAFSIVISIALAGNMIVNYIMGIVAEAFGIQHLTTFAFTLSILMALLSLMILNKLTNTNNH